MVQWEAASQSRWTDAGETGESEALEKVGVLGGIGARVSGGARLATCLIRRYAVERLGELQEQGRNGARTTKTR